MKEAVGENKIEVKRFKGTTFKTMTNNNSSLRRQRAMADAIAGVAGSLVSLWAFYPIEVWKTNVQAQPHGGEDDDDEQDGDEEQVNDNNTQVQDTAGQKTRRRRRDLNWLQGIGSKTLHVTSSSFCYFYIYSFIVSTYKRRHSPGGNLIITPMRRLLLSAMAAMLNTIFTLPLDVISSRHVTAAKTKATTKAKQLQHQEEHIENNQKSSNIPMEGEEKSPDISMTSTKMTNSLFVTDETSSIKAMAAAAQAVGLNLLMTTASQKEASSLLQNDDDDTGNSPFLNLSGGFRFGEEEKKEDILTLLSDEERGFTNHNGNPSRQKNLSIYYDCLSHEQQSRSSSASTTTMSSSLYATPLSSLSPSSSSFQLRDDTPKPPSSSSLIQQCITSFRELQSLWKGLVPALLLCSNPAIHYTVFDVLKTNLLSLPGGARRKKSKLSMSEAFILGLLAKFVATMVTYPLIRAKVLLMVSKSKPLLLSSSKSSSSLDATVPTTMSSSSSLSSPIRDKNIKEGDTKNNNHNSLLSCLIQSYQRDGIINGLYKGCSWQLIHTVLKSALMMMVRERITETTHKLIVG